MTTSQAEGDSPSTDQQWLELLQSKIGTVLGDSLGTMLSDYTIENGSPTLKATSDFPEHLKIGLPKSHLLQAHSVPTEKTQAMLKRLIPKSAMSINEVADEAADEAKWQMHEYFMMTRTSPPDVGMLDEFPDFSYAGQLKQMKAAALGAARENKAEVVELSEQLVALTGKTWPLLPEGNELKKLLETVVDEILPKTKELLDDRKEAERKLFTNLSNAARFNSREESPEFKKRMAREKRNTRPLNEQHISMFALAKYVVPHIILGMDSFQTFAVRAPYPDDHISRSGIGLSHEYVCVLAASRGFCEGMSWFSCPGLPPILRMGVPAPTRDSAISCMYWELFLSWMQDPDFFETHLRNSMEGVVEDEIEDDGESVSSRSDITAFKIDEEDGKQSSSSPGPAPEKPSKPDNGAGTQKCDFIAKLEDRLEFEKKEQLSRMRDPELKIPSQQDLTKQRILRRRALLQLHVNRDEMRPRSTQERREHYQAAMDLIDQDPHISQDLDDEAWEPKYPQWYVDKRQPLP